MGYEEQRGNTEKVFTQDEVNRIIQERMNKEKIKQENIKREQELLQMALAISAQNKLSEGGLPLTLHKAMNLNSKEEMEESFEIIQREFLKAKKRFGQFKGIAPINGKEGASEM